MKKILVFLLAIFSFTLIGCSNESKIINTIYHDTTTSNEEAVNSAYDKAANSSCYLTSTLQTESTSMFGHGHVTTKTTEFSGVLVKKEGSKNYILSYYHLGNLNNSVSVKTNESSYTGTIVGLDSSNLLSLVLVDDSSFDLTAAVLEEDDLVKGSDTIVVSQISEGSPMNYLNKGFLSYYNEYLVSTDAPTNYLSLGAGIFNLEGKLIGLISQEETDDTSSSYQGICYAIRSIHLDTITSQMIEEGELNRPLMGITVSWYSNDLMDDYGYNYPLPDDDCHEVVVDITSGKNGDLAGIKLGDVIMSVNGVVLSSKNQLTAIMRTSIAGDSIVLGIKRYNSTTKSFADISITVTLNA